MVKVDQWFDSLPQSNAKVPVQKIVYIATDEEQVVKEALEKYPHYQFLYFSYGGALSGTIYERFDLICTGATPGSMNMQTVSNSLFFLDC